MLLALQLILKKPAVLFELSQTEIFENLISGNNKNLENIKSVLNKYEKNIEQTAIETDFIEIDTSEILQFIK